MARLWLGGVGLVALLACGSAYAASPISTWTGFYIGANAGYGFGNPSSFLTWNRLANNVAPLTPADYSTNVSGALGGLQFGYNYQINNFVIGAETDFQFSDISGETKTGSTFIPFLTDFAHFNEDQKLKWLGTVRARGGVLATPSLLIFATGGLAYGSVQATSTFAFETPPFATYTGSTTQTRVGWTAGGGVEWALDRAWSIKGEYLYYDLGTISVTGDEPGNAGFHTLLDQKVNGQIVRVGVNFKFN